MGGAVGAVAAGVGGALLSRSSGSRGSASTQQAPTLTKEQKDALNKTLLPFLQEVPLGDLQGPEFPGAEGFKFSQPLTEGEQTSLTALEQRALGGIEGGEGQDFLSQLLQKSGDERQDTESSDFLTNLFTEGVDAFEVGEDGPLSQFFEFDQEGFDEFFDASVVQPLLESFERDILPAITRRGAGTGNLFGTATRESISRQQENLVDEIAKQRSIQGFQARQAGLDRGLQAASLAEQLEASGFESARAREFDAAQGVFQAEETRDLQQNQQQLEAALGAEGLDIQRSTLELQSIIANIAAQGISRGVANQEIAAQYADFLRREGLEDKRINQLLASIGLPAVENITTVSGGSAGVDLGGVASIISAVGSF